WAGNVDATPASYSWTVALGPQLQIIDTPSAGVVGQPLAPIAFQLADSSGNPLSQDQVVVTIRVVSGNITVATTTATSDSTGRITVNNLQTTRPGTFKIIASAPGLVTAISDGFVVTAE